MSAMSVLRQHLITYAKTKDVFAAYKASGYDREFYEAHRDMPVSYTHLDVYKRQLPNNAFRANAGTDVVSDIIFLQKRDHPIAVSYTHLRTDFPAGLPSVRLQKAGGTTLDFLDGGQCDPGRLSEAPTGNRI